MTIEHGIIRLLLVISLLIVVPGVWISGEQFLEARTTFHPVVNGVGLRHSGQCRRLVQP